MRPTGPGIRSTPANPSLGRPWRSLCEVARLLPSRGERFRPARGETKERTRVRLRPYVERAQRFSGWSFGDIEARRVGPEAPWDYEARARRLLRDASSVLDMGTGGGEIFMDLLRSCRGRAVATEEWARNVPIAARRLSSIGVHVVRCRSQELPFHDSTFDLVLNRHEELDPAEVARVLSPGGRFLTQQVGRGDWRELRAYFPRMQDFGPLFEDYRSGLQRKALLITQAASHDTQVAYPGLGEVVFMLCVTPWTIPDFSPLGDDLDALLHLERDLSTDEGIVLTESRFLIEARNPD